jgi:hypothetical protein
VHARDIYTFEGRPFFERRRNRHPKMTFSRVRCEEACARERLAEFFKYRRGVPDAEVLFGPARRESARERVAWLLERAGPLWGAQVHYDLGVHLDSLLAGAQACDWAARAHEDALPDLTLDVLHVAVWHGQSGRRAAAPSGRVALMNVLLKIMPDNGQPRELNRFVLRAVEEDVATRDALHAVAAAALLGNYRHCRFKPGEAARAEVLASFTPEAFVATLRSTTQGNLLMFYVLREYLHVLGKYVTPYRSLMGCFFAWEKQNSRVCDMMREVREAVHASCDWRSVFCDRAHTEAYKRHYRRLPKRKTLARELCPARTLLHVAERSCRARRMRPPCAVFDAPRAVLLLAEGGAPRANAVPAALRAAGEVGAAEAAEATLAHVSDQRSHSKALSLTVPLERATDAQLAALHDAAALAARRAATFVVSLPRAFARAQVAAVARRFGCAPGDWATVRRATRVYVCTCCARVKNFFVTEGAKATFTRASGYEKLVFPSPLDAAPLLRRDADCVPRLSCASSPECRLFRAEAHDLLEPLGDGARGGALQTAAGCLTVSPCCGVLTALRALRVTGAGFTCPACRAPPAPRARAAEKGASSSWRRGRGACA